MRAILPAPGPVDAVASHAGAARPAPAGRPWSMLNMVASIDGSAAVDGTSRLLGCRADKVVFSALRSVADVVLVGAQTARAEGYGPPKPSTARREERRNRGQRDAPRIAVVSRSLDLDHTSPLFTEVTTPTLVLTVDDAPADRRRDLSTVAEVVDAGHRTVDLATAMATLRRSGEETVLVEGGPSLNGQLLALDLFDEVNVTLAPTLVGGTGPRLAFGDAETIRRFELGHLWEEDDFLFARYLRQR